MIGSVSHPKKGRVSDNRPILNSDQVNKMSYMTSSNRPHKGRFYTSGAPNTLVVQSFAFPTNLWSLGYLIVCLSIHARNRGLYIEKRSAEIAKNNHPWSTGNTRPAKPNTKKKLAKVRMRIFFSFFLSIAISIIPDSLPQAHTLLPLLQ